MNKRLLTILQYVFFLGLGIFFVWWSVKDIDGEKKDQIREALRHARYYLVGPVFFILFLSHYIRALRWRLLIQSLGYSPDKANVYFAVLIGYLTNLAVPRLGEVLKCTVLARYEKVPADKLIGTIILERLIDAISLLIILIVTLAVQPGLYSQLMSSVFIKKGEESPEGMSGYLIAAIVLGVIAVAIIIWMIVKKKNLRDLFTGIKKIASRVWQGLSAVRHLKKRGEFLFLTLMLWTAYIGGGYLGFMALQETQHYGIKEALTVLVAGSIGMIVTPGGIGTYPYLLERTMMLYGLKDSIAIAFGWILWLAQTVVILIGGVISFGLLPWYNKRKLKRAGL